MNVVHCLCRSTAKVVVSFADSADMKLLLEELARNPSPPRQWIGSEGWVNHPQLMSFSFCAGTVGVTLPQFFIPGLEDFLLDLSPSEVAASSALTEFWEDAFNCTLAKSENK